MSSAIFGKLAKDVKIKIKRSNGVVHAATITSLVEENHTVNVEVRICAWNQVSVNLSGTARWYDFKTFPNGRFPLGHCRIDPHSTQSGHMMAG